MTRHRPKHTISGASSCQEIEPQRSQELLENKRNPSPSITRSESRETSPININQVKKIHS